MVAETTTAAKLQMVSTYFCCCCCQALTNGAWVTCYVSCHVHMHTTPHPTHKAVFLFPQFPIQSTWRSALPVKAKNFLDLPRGGCVMHKRDKTKLKMQPRFKQLPAKKYKLRSLWQASTDGKHDSNKKAGKIKERVKTKAKTRIENLIKTKEKTLDCISGHKPIDMVLKYAKKW